MSEFGASFKKAREALGLSLNEIADKTRISTRFLVAIEREEFDLLPGGIFKRGFIRTYAGHIGLNVEKVLAEYEQLAQLAKPEAMVRPGSGTGSERHLYILTIAALALSIVLFYIVTRNPARSTVTANPSVAEEPGEATEVPAPDIPAAEPRAVPAPPSLPTGPTNPAETGQGLTVEMEVHETTWIRVAADGASVVAGEVLEPGATRRYIAQSSIGLKIGNAGGLTLKVNNRQVQRLGRSGQVRELMITPANLADIIG